MDLKDTYVFYGIKEELPDRLRKTPNGIKVTYYSAKDKKQLFKTFKLKKGFGNKAILLDALNFARNSYLITDNPNSTTGYKGIELKEYKGDIYLIYYRKIKGNYRRRCVKVNKSNYKKALYYAVINKAKDRNIPTDIKIDYSKLEETMKKLLKKDNND